MHEITKTIQESINFESIQSLLVASTQEKDIVNFDIVVVDRPKVISHILQSQIKLVEVVKENLKKSKKYSGKHNKSHTWIDNGYCHGCKSSLNSEQLAEEFSYNQAIEDQISSLTQVLNELKNV